MGVAPEDGFEAARALAAVERRLFGAGASTDVASIGRFSVLQRVGHGGMGVVYAAWDPELSRRVAVKVVRPDSARTTGAQLIAEARALAQIRHPNVVAIYDAGETEGRVWIAMEFMPSNLAAWLTGDPPTVAVLDAFAQAGRGLAAAHAAGIVHRDFKPANVLRGDDGTCIVADFGLARAVDDTDGIAGTPYYMPLEQLNGRNVDARSDQFSYCMALHQALWGEHPYEGATHPERVHAMTERRLWRASAGPSRVSSGLRRAVLRGVLLVAAAPGLEEVKIVVQIGPARRDGTRPTTAVRPPAGSDPLWKLRGEGRVAFLVAGAKAATLDAMNRFALAEGSLLDLEARLDGAPDPDRRAAAFVSASERLRTRPMVVAMRYRYPRGRLTDLIPIAGALRSD